MDSVTTGIVPVPDNATVAGLVAAFVDTSTVAVRDPVAEGVSVIEIVQLVPDDNDAPHVVVSNT